MPRTAVVIAEPGLIAERVVAAWLADGNRISCIVSSSAAARSVDWRARLRCAASGVQTLGVVAHRNAIPVIALPRTDGGRTIFPDDFGGGADTLITAMTLLIVPPEILSRFEYAVNVHPALLPHYKGPVPRLGLLADAMAHRYGGVTLHVLEPTIDTGPIIAQRPTPLTPRMSYWTWEATMAAAAADTVRNELRHFMAGTAVATPQMGVGSYRQRAPGEFRIAATHTAADAERFIDRCRGFTVMCDLGRHQLGDPQPGGRHPVTQLKRRIGAPTDASPVVRTWTIEMDLSDARVVFARRRAPHRGKDWVARTVATRRTLKVRARL